MRTLNSGLAEIPIGELVAKDWRLAEIFKKYEIDFCCGGKKTVVEACAKRGIDTQSIVSELRNALEAPAIGQPNYNQWDLGFLTDYIVNNHHQYVTTASPFLDEISQKVVRVHGDRHPELNGIRVNLVAVIEELAMHMKKEELILFPYIKQLAEGSVHGGSVVPPAFGTIANPIRMMESEHTSAGGAMEEVSRLSNHFTPPADGCTSYRVLFAKLHEFQQDLFQHIHLENNILFPKALHLESELMRR